MMPTDSTSELVSVAFANRDIVVRKLGFLKPVSELSRQGMLAVESREQSLRSAQYSSTQTTTTYGCMASFSYQTLSGHVKFHVMERLKIRRLFSISVRRHILKLRMAH